MASADGWWNNALRQWGASSAAERKRRKTKQVGGCGGAADERKGQAGGDGVVLWCDCVGSVGGSFSFFEVVRLVMVILVHCSYGDRLPVGW